MHQRGWRVPVQMPRVSPVGWGLLLLLNAKNLMLGAVPLSRVPSASPWLHPAPTVPPGLVTRDMSYQSCCS